MPYLEKGNRLLEQRAKVADLAQRDRVENAKVRKRSLGRCEVRIYHPWARGMMGGTDRCPRRASEIHHLIGGSGRRNKGKSILAEHKLHVCGGIGGCHPDITGKVLQPLGTTDERESAATVRYQRVGK